MIYSKEDILLESEFCGDMASIYRSTDMIIDSIMESVDTITDVDTFLESGSDVFKGIIAQIRSIFKRIMDFVTAQVDKVKAFRQAKKYKAIMTPAAKAQIVRIKGGDKIPCPDLKKMYAACQKYQTECDKYINFVNDELEKVYKDPNYDIKKLTDAGEDAISKTNAIAVDIRNALEDKHDMTVKDVYAMLDLGFKSMEEIQSYIVKIDSEGKKLISIIAKLEEAAESPAFKEYVESCEEYYTVEGDTIVYEAGKIKAGIGKIRSGLNNVVHKIDKMLTDHARTISMVLGAISVICGSIAAGTGISSEVKHKIQSDKNEAAWKAKVNANNEDAARAHKDINKNVSSEVSASTLKNAHKKIHRDKVTANRRADDDFVYDQIDIDAERESKRKPTALTALGSVASGAAALAMSRKGKK